jgi:riboflavin-specific deaminase-like protein
VPWQPLADPEVTRLYPTDGPAVSLAEAISDLGLADRAPEDRPYLVLDMVSAADGKATIEGRTSQLGDEADRALFHHLRTQADAVMVGAGTVRVERYGPMIKDEALREKRRREGLAPDPLTVIVSRSGHLPPDLPLLQDPDSRVVVITAAEDEIEGVTAQVEYLRSGRATFDLRPLVERLRTEHGVRSVLCEGGPTLNASLFAYGLVDELFLTLAPQIVGGRDALTIVAGEPLPEPVQLELAGALGHGAELLLRYRVRG